MLRLRGSFTIRRFGARTLDDTARAGRLHLAWWSCSVWHNLRPKKTFESIVGASKASHTLGYVILPFEVFLAILQGSARHVGHRRHWIQEGSEASAAQSVLIRHYLLSEENISMISPSDCVGGFIALRSTTAISCFQVLTAMEHTEGVPLRYQGLRYH